MTSSPDVEPGDGDDDDPGDLVLVTTCGDNSEANIVRGMLQSAGIDALVQGEHHRAMLGMLGAYVELRIMVPERDLERARHLLELAAEDYETDLDATGEADGESAQAHAANKPRSVFLPIFLGLFITFGTGHMYARKWTRAGILAVAEMFLLGLRVAGVPEAGLGIVAVMLADGIGGAIAVSRQNRALPKPAGD